jgi:hypothetical protein
VLQLWRVRPYIRPKCPHPREDTNGIVAVTTTMDADAFNDDFSDTSDGYAFVAQSVPILVDSSVSADVSSNPMVVLSTNKEAKLRTLIVVSIF